MWGVKLILICYFVIYIIYVFNLNILEWMWELHNAELPVRLANVEYFPDQDETQVSAVEHVCKAILGIGEHTRMS